MHFNKYLPLPLVLVSIYSRLSGGNINFVKDIVYETGACVSYVEHTN